VSDTYIELTDEWTTKMDVKKGDIITITFEALGIYNQKYVCEGRDGNKIFVKLLDDKQVAA
jgi:hypothetical protein